MGFWSWLIGEDEIEQRAEPTQEVTPPVSDVLLKALLKLSQISERSSSCKESKYGDKKDIYFSSSEM